MTTTRTFVSLSTLVLLWAGCASAPQNETTASETDETIAAFISDYHPVEAWPQVPEGWTLGETAGVAVDQDGDVWIFTRGEHPLIEFRADGTFVRSLLEGTVSRAHGLRVDKDNNIWVTDVGAHTVAKHDQQGKVLLSLGERDRPGEDESHFNAPSDVAFAPNGDFFVADGHDTNNRIVKFDSNGKFLTTWGTKGTGESQFDVPHALVVGSDNRLYVGDRENDRIQIFDLNGNFIEMWTHLGAPFGLAVSDGRIYMSDGRAFKVLVADLEGNVLGSFGSEGTGPGQFNPPHDLSVAVGGEIYVAEPRNMRAQKFTIPSSGTPSEGSTGG